MRSMRRKRTCPIAGLLTDLKARGLLDSTLVALALRIRPNAPLREWRGPRP
jgi:hypothetical protein